MKLGQLTEYNNSNIFFKHYAENKPSRLVPDLYGGWGWFCGLIAEFIYSILETFIR